jgi:hypothetical protein
VQAARRWGTTASLDDRRTPCVTVAHAIFRAWRGLGTDTGRRVGCRRPPPQHMPKNRESSCGAPRCYWIASSGPRLQRPSTEVAPSSGGSRPSWTYAPFPAHICSMAFTIRWLSDSSASCRAKSVVADTARGGSARIGVEQGRPWATSRQPKTLIRSLIAFEQAGSRRRAANNGVPFLTRHDATS